MQAELACAWTNPAEQIQGVDHFAGYAAGRAVIVDAFLAPVEACAHQLPVMPFDPLAQLTAGVRVTLHQVESEAADVLQRFEQGSEVVPWGYQGLLANHEPPEASQLL